jgi:hypothetical protein
MMRLSPIPIKLPKLLVVLTVLIAVVPSVAVADTYWVNISPAGSADEGDGVNFTITMIEPAPGGAPKPVVAGDDGVGVTFRTENISAVGGVDFPIIPPSGGSVTFNEGEVSKQITVATTPDDIIEADETFTVRLDGPINAGGGVVQSCDICTGTATITNDDTATLTISDETQNEGSGVGTTNFNFTVTSPKEVQGGFDLAFAVDDGTATDADDFNVTTTVPVTFAGTVGETQTITVAVSFDDKALTPRQPTTSRRVRPARARSPMTIRLR